MSDEIGNPFSDRRHTARDVFRRVAEDAALAAMAAVVMSITAAVVMLMVTLVVWALP